MDKIRQSIVDGFLSIGKGMASIFSWASPASYRQSQLNCDDWASIGEDFKSVGDDITSAMREYQDFHDQMKKMSHMHQDDINRQLLGRRNRWPLLSEEEIRELVKQYLAADKKSKH